MQTVFDKVFSDFLILSMLENISALGTISLSQMLPEVGLFQAKVMCLCVYFFMCATLIHLSTFCCTRLACIYLVGTIENFSGKYS